MEPQQPNWIANFIWGIADDVIRNLYIRGKRRNGIHEYTAHLALMSSEGGLPNLKVHQCP